MDFLKWGTKDTLCGEGSGGSLNRQVLLLESCNPPRWEQTGMLKTYIHVAWHGRVLGSSRNNLALCSLFHVDPYQIQFDHCFQTSSRFLLRVPMCGSGCTIN